MATKTTTPQQEMEEAVDELFREYCRKDDGRMNTMCNPQLVRCDFEKKSLTLKYDVKDWMMNPLEVMHGGVVATVFDLTMGMLARLLYGRIMPTTQMAVTYLRPVPDGSTFLVEAVCVMQGKTICVINAESWIEAKPDKLTATSTGTYFAG